MIKVFYITLFNLLIANNAWACPGCAGSMEDGRSSNTAYVLMVFIALIYIPFSMIFKMIVKNRRLNDQLNDEG